MLFVIDSVIKRNIEMQPTNTVRPPGPQEDVTFLRVGTKRVAFVSILWRLVKSKLQAMRGIILAMVVNRLFLGGCGLSAGNGGAFGDPSSGRQVALVVLF